MAEKLPIPPLTCPHIDRVIELADSMVNLVQNENISEDVMLGYKNIIGAEMEFIRTSTDELRVASKHWYDEYKKRAKRTTRR